MKAGLLMKAVKVSTELNVKSPTTHSEKSNLTQKNGEILDENSKEKTEVNQARLKRNGFHLS